MRPAVRRPPTSLARICPTNPPPPTTPPPPQTPPPRPLPATTALRPLSPFALGRHDRRARRRPGDRFHHGARRRHVLLARRRRIVRIHFHYPDLRNLRRPGAGSTAARTAAEPRAARRRHGRHGRHGRH